MAIYVDEIIVSFNINDGIRSIPSGQSRVNYKYEYKLNDIKYCPNCKICRDIQCFRSLNKSKEYNKLCRRCLNSTKGYKQKQCLYKGL